jgi:hypothetical protein
VPVAVQAMAEQFADLLVPAVAARRQAGPLSVEEPVQGVVNRYFRERRHRSPWLHCARRDAAPVP